MPEKSDRAEADEKPKPRKPHDYRRFERSLNTYSKHLQCVVM